MATNRIHTITTDNGTRITITVNGENFTIERDDPSPNITPPVGRWELRNELVGVKLLVIGFGMAAAGFSALSFFFGLFCRIGR